MNQNSSVHPSRRYRTTGPNGPADPAIAANVSWLASARSVADVRRHSGLPHPGVRNGSGLLSSTSTAIVAAAPAPNHHQSRGAPIPATA